MSKQLEIKRMKRGEVVNPEKKRGREERWFLEERRGMR